LQGFRGVVLEIPPFGFGPRKGLRDWYLFFPLFYWDFFWPSVELANDCWLLGPEFPAWSFVLGDSTEEGPLSRVPFGLVLFGG